MTIIGTDEVGRGCIAGPIVAGSFGINTHKLIYLYTQLKSLYIQESKLTNKKRIERVLALINHDLKLTNNNPTAKVNTRTGRVNVDIKVFQHVYDSKKVTQNNRKLVLEQIIKVGDFGIGVVSNLQIDKHGLQQANVDAMEKSKSNLQYWSSTGPVLYISDLLKIKKQDGSNANVQAIKKGDAKSFVIAAASIIAKEYRDSLMLEYHKIYPNYGFDKHVGYGTKLHIENIKKYDLSPIHRKSVKIK